MSALVLPAPPHLWIPKSRGELEAEWRRQFQRLTRGVGRGIGRGLAPREVTQPAGGATFGRTYIGSATDTTDVSDGTYTFSAFNTGSNSNGTRVLVCIAGRPQSSGGGVSTVTIGGTGATVHTTTGAGSGGATGIASLDSVASGTHDIVVVFDQGNVDHCQILVYRIADATVNDAQSAMPTGSSTSVSDNLTVTEGDIVIAVASKVNTATISYSIVTADDFNDVESTGSGCGSVEGASAGSPATETASWSGSAGNRNISLISLSESV